MDYKFYLRKFLVFLYVVAGEKDKLKTGATFLHSKYLLYKSCAQLFLRRSVENYRHYTDEGVKSKQSIWQKVISRDIQFGIQYLCSVMRWRVTSGPCLGVRVVRGSSAITVILWVTVGFCFNMEWYFVCVYITNYLHFITVFFKFLTP